MNELELKLKQYLETKEGEEIIKKSLDDNCLHYEKIDIESVIIENEKYFELRIFLLKDLTVPAITILPLPEKFIRKMKLQMINGN